MEGLQGKKKEDEIEVKKSNYIEMWSSENFLNGKCTDVLEA